MKRFSLGAALVFGVIAGMAFQNCSQGHFESVNSSSSGELEAAVQDINLGMDVADSKLIRVCPTVMCAAPPVNCRYVHDPVDSSTEESICSHNCGRLVCDPLPPIVEPPIAPPVGVKPPVRCPMIACAYEEGCKFAGQPTLNRNGCPIDCGKRVCDTRRIRRPPFAACPAIAIACLDNLPGPNCRLDYSKTRDENGCVVRCPDPVCPEPAQ